jgi:addiction module HigA family antidote
VLLRLFMSPLGLTAYRVSTDLGVPPIAISEILRGRRSISPAMSARLGTYFGVEPHFWLALQSAYDLRLIEQVVDDEHPSNGVTRCGALIDRQFVIRESKNGTDRSYEVILARVRMVTTNRPTATTAAQPKKTHPAPAKPAGKNGKK